MLLETQVLSELRRGAAPVAPKQAEVSTAKWPVLERQGRRLGVQHPQEKEARPQSSSLSSVASARPRLGAESLRRAASPPGWHLQEELAVVLAASKDAEPAHPWAAH